MPVNQGVFLYAIGLFYCLDILDAILTDNLAMDISDALGIAAEYAGGLIFLQYNRIAVYVDLQRVTYCNAQISTQLNR